METVTDYFIGSKSREIELIAKKINFDKVIFVKEIKELSDFRDIDSYEYILINTNDRAKMRQFIDKALARKKRIIVHGKDDSFNRAALETKRISILLSPESTAKKDFMNWRNSGLNQVLCKIATKNKIAIGIPFAQLLEIQNSKELAERLGRIMQNIFLCRKYNTKMQLANFSSEKNLLRAALDLRSFGIVAGMTAEQANQSLAIDSISH